MSHIKNIFLLVVVLFINGLNNVYATTVKDLINPDNGTVTDIMVEILGEAGIHIKGISAKDYWPTQIAVIDSKSCEDVTKLIQGKDERYPNVSWRALENKERWEMNIEGIGKTHQEILINLILLPQYNGIKGLNMGAETYPKIEQQTPNYSYLLLGSTLGDFKVRVEFLYNFLNALSYEYSAKNFILTGKRELNDAEKNQLSTDGSAEALSVLDSNNEKEGMEWVYAESNLKYLAPTTINDAEPRGPRASTESTLVLFFDQVKPTKDTKIIAVSTHIFALYQYLILKRVALEKGFEGEIAICAPALIGTERDAYPNSRKLAMLLDNLARIFYEICEYKKKTGRYPD
jgi:hypothetical protein